MLHLRQRVNKRTIGPSRLCDSVLERSKDRVRGWDRMHAYGRRRARPYVSKHGFMLLWQDIGWIGNHNFRMRGLATSLVECFAERILPYDAESTSIGVLNGFTLVSTAVFRVMSVQIPLLYVLIPHLRSVLVNVEICESLYICQKRGILTVPET
ncbi:hypothetical protein VTN00DRAFT_6355 [Thermoascus crustaceus]|uniref:uncharacterized protein n=1 Tax=Thermoascus crustaceus TaxID=5088 RepID=UPI003743850E